MTALAMDPREARARLARSGAGTIRRICVVPEDITVTDWAARERILPETSASPGEFNPDVVPYARRWMDLGADPSVSKIALCWASQTTKSTVIENILAYRIVHMPGPMIVVQPKIDAAEAWAKERFVPMVRATPALASRVRLGRSTDSTLRYKAFPGGFLYVASAQSATELASRSAPTVASDEVDRMEVIPGEGSPVEIVDARQGSSDIGLHILTSTPRAAETTIIWPYLEGGTYELFHVRCPDCGQMQPFFWSSLRWDPGHPETAMYKCGGAGAAEVGREQSPVLEQYLKSNIAQKDESGKLIGCGSLIDERHKPVMLLGGEWRATNPDAEYPSSHLHGLYSPFAKSKWSVLADKFEKALGKPADLQVVINTRFAEVWRETADVLNADAILSKLEPMGHVLGADGEELTQSLVPDGVGVLTAGLDVQGNRIEMDVWGWGAGLESWLIACLVFGGDPAREPNEPGSVWDLVDQALLRMFPHVSGQSLPIAAALIDSGFEATKVYRFTHTKRHRKVFAAKGVGGEGLQILGKASVQTKDRTLMYPVGVDAAKTEFLRSQLLEEKPGPGFAHLPDWLKTDQAKQYVSEKRVRRLERGRVIREWRKKHEDDANERLDCRNYARASLELLGARYIADLGDKANGFSVRVVPKTEGEPDAGESTERDVEEQRRSARRSSMSEFRNRWRNGG